MVDTKEITVSHNWSGLIPKEIVLQWAKNYKLTILPTANWVWCMFALTIPGLDDKEYQIKTWFPIILNFTNPKPWKYNVVCTAMWMRHWSLIIK